MDIAKQRLEILQQLGSDLANRVRSFMVTSWNGMVMVVTKNREVYWHLKVSIEENGETKTVTELTVLDVPEVVHMAQDHRHTLFLNKQGEIYSMGENYHGQSGLGTEDPEDYFVPQLIPSPHKFISVRCGFEHSLALTEDGKVWAWGKNTKNGQVSGLNSYRIVAVECGGRHSLSLTDRGEVYGWGWNNWGQLGYESETSPNTPIPIRIPTPSPVQSMAAGYSHTLLLTQTGEVYACGSNGYGQLGLPRTTDSSLRLSKVEGLPPISQIASHPVTSLSIAMSLDQRCFVWGELRADSKFNSTPRELPPEYSTVDSTLFSFSRIGYNPYLVSIPETPPSPLSARMSRMFDNPETSPDVQFVVEQRTIHAHRIILSNSSDYFARMFSERWLAPVDPADPIVRVTITDHSYQVFYAFLRFLYTDSLEVHYDLLPDLFDLASLYLVPDLQQLCLSRMLITITPSTCCLYYQLTNRHLLPELATFQQKLVQFISTHTLEVYRTAVYQSMEPDVLDKLTNAVRNFQTLDQNTQSDGQRHSDS